VKLKRTGLMIRVQFGSHKNSLGRNSLDWREIMNRWIISETYLRSFTWHWRDSLVTERWIVMHMVFFSCRT